MNDRSVVGREVNPSRRNSRADAFSAQATKEPVPQLVLDPVLVDEGRDMVPHRKVQGVFAESGDEAHRRGGVAQEAGDGADGPCDLIEQPASRYRRRSPRRYRPP
jgi:hypothetical protein